MSNLPGDPVSMLRASIREARASTAALIAAHVAELSAVVAAVEAKPKPPRARKSIKRRREPDPFRLPAEEPVKAVTSPSPQSAVPPTPVPAALPSAPPETASPRPPPPRAVNKCETSKRTMFRDQLPSGCKKSRSFDSCPAPVTFPSASTSASFPTVPALLCTSASSPQLTEASYALPPPYPSPMPTSTPTTPAAPLPPTSVRLPATPTAAEVARALTVPSTTTVHPLPTNDPSLSSPAVFEALKNRRKQMVPRRAQQTPPPPPATPPIQARVEPMPRVPTCTVPQPTPTVSAPLPVSTSCQPYSPRTTTVTPPEFESKLNAFYDNDRLSSDAVSKSQQRPQSSYASQLSLVKKEEVAKSEICKRRFEPSPLPIPTSVQDFVLGQPTLPTTALAPHPLPRPTQEYHAFPPAQPQAAAMHPARRGRHPKPSYQVYLEEVAAKIQQHACEGISFPCQCSGFMVQIRQNNGCHMLNVGDSGRTVSNRPIDFSEGSRQGIALLLEQHVENHLRFLLPCPVCNTPVPAIPRLSALHVGRCQYHDESSSRGQAFMTELEQHMLSAVITYFPFKDIRVSFAPSIFFTRKPPQTHFTANTQPQLAYDYPFNA